MQEAKVGYLKRRSHSYTPAPVQMLWPSGEVARKRTRAVCPVSVATGVSSGYRHTSIALVEYPAMRNHPGRRSQGLNHPLRLKQTA